MFTCPSLLGPLSRTMRHARKGLKHSSYLSESALGVVDAHAVLSTVHPASSLGQCSTVAQQVQARVTRRPSTGIDKLCHQVANQLEDEQPPLRDHGDNSVWPCDVCSSQAHTRAYQSFPLPNPSSSAATEPATGCREPLLPLPPLLLPAFAPAFLLLDLP